MLRAGGVWGEDMLICSEKLRTKWCARALTYLEVYMISRASLLMVAVNYEDTYKKIRKHVMYLALKRGLILIAERVKARDAALRQIGLSPSVYKSKVKGKADTGGGVGSFFGVGKESNSSAASADAARNEYFGQVPLEGGPLPQIAEVDNAPLEWAIAGFVRAPAPFRPNMAQIGAAVDEMHAPGASGERTAPSTGELSTFLHGFGDAKGGPPVASQDQRLPPLPQKATAPEFDPANGAPDAEDEAIHACYKAGRADRALRDTDETVCGANVQQDTAAQSTLKDAIAGGGSALGKVSRSLADTLREEMRMLAAAQDRQAEALANLTREISKGFADLKQPTPQRGALGGWLQA